MFEIIQKYPTNGKKKESVKNGIGLNHCTKTTSPSDTKAHLHFPNALDYQSVFAEVPHFLPS